MSDKDQYLKMFFAESKEYILTLNENILSLENNPEDEEVINSLFRVAHSLKGMSATMGFDTLTELTHKLENLMDKIRNKNIQVTTEIIDILFSGIDRIEAIVQQIKEEGSDAMDLSSFLQQLEEIINQETTDQSATVISDNTSLSLTNDDLIAIKSNKKALDKVYSFVVSFDDEAQFVQVRASMVMKTAGENGYVFKSQPAQEDISEATFEDCTLKFILLSKNSVEDLQEEIEKIIDVASVTVEEIDISEQTVETSAKATTTSSKFEMTSYVKVDIEKLDKLMNMIGELLINKTRLEELKLDGQVYKDVIPQLDRVTMELHHTVMQIRMEPIGGMFNRFPRMVRDLAKSTQKEINFQMEGKETELDRSIIEELGDPMTHLIRNAIDHGIEKPDVRQQQGKPKEGNVTLRAFQKGQEIIIEVEDDGNGINIEKVVDKIVEKEVYTAEEVQAMDRDEKLQLIFEPGLSTTDEVSDVSGRGVGMDVVKRNIEKLDGDIYIRSEQGKGTKFIISLPLTLAIQDALMVKINNEVFAIPLSDISETIMVKTEDIKKAKGHDVIILRGKTITVVDSRKSLALPIDDSYASKEEVPMVIVKSGGKEIALVVGELLSQQEIVIKSLGDYLRDIECISGATIVGDGAVALILDVRDIV